MPGFLKWVFRPGVLIAVSIVLVGAAGVVMLPMGNSAGRPHPLPVRSDEQEIVWLYPATNTTSWDRFAMAVQQASEHLRQRYPGVEVEHDSGRTPAATAVPEVALSWPETPRDTRTHDIPPGLRGKRLVFRWYKLTSEWSLPAWIEALLARDPPPLAIIGGNTSNAARELALQLERTAVRLPEARRPLLLLTYATADRVPGRSSPADDPFLESASLAAFREENQTVSLTGLYPGRTFRFCFTNRQMASAVTRFIWSQPGLRPDSDPAYLVQWTDDSYSQNLFAEYIRVLDRRAAENLHEAAAQQWAWVSGCAGLGFPPALLGGWYTSGFRYDAAVQLDVDSSVGPFAAPNPFEARIVRDRLAKMQPGGTLPVPGRSLLPPAKSGEVALTSLPAPRRPLLVITGQAQPSRRLLRDLARSAPDAARRFVVAMGDAVSFNIIYRDRLVTWPVQDLPFSLVFFCHKNPIDAGAGFPAQQAASEPRTRASGTEDLLLYRDLVEAAGLAFCRDGKPIALASELVEGLLAVRQVEGRLSLDNRAVVGGVSSPSNQSLAPLFSANGQRKSGSGEHVVYLQPVWEDDRVLPQARIEVWARQNDSSWRRQGKPLTVSYDESEVHDVSDR